MRELKLRYIIELISNIGQKAAADLKQMQAAEAALKGETQNTNTAIVEQGKAAAQAGKAVRTTATDLKQMQGAEAALKGETQNTNTAIVEQGKAAGQAGKAVRIMAADLDAAKSKAGETARVLHLTSDELDVARRKVDAFLTAMRRAGSDTSMERQAGYMKRLVDSMDTVGRRMAPLMAHGPTALGAFGQGVLKAGDAALAVGAVGAASAWGAGRVLGPALRNFTSLEDAQTALRVALMHKGGKIDPAYAAIAQVANALGIQLPGTPTDYFGAAVALAEQGVAPSAIASGGLKSAAQIGVLLRMNRADAAGTVARIREAFGVRDEELGDVADIVQRHSYAFGVRPEGIREAASYSGSMLSALGLRSKKHLSGILTLQGMAQQAGLGDSQFGTNFAMMLTMLSKGPLLIDEAKRGMKGDVRRKLDAAGIKLDFFDEHGHLKTINGDPFAALVKELEKFETLRRTAGEETASEAAAAMFGQQGVRPAMILGQLGLEGYTAARQKVAEQANIDERILEASRTLAWKLETLSGNVQYLTAVMADGLGKGLKGPTDRAADIAGKLTGWVSEHPAAGSAALLGAAGTAAALGGIGARSGLRMLGMHGAAARVMPALGRAGIWGAATWGGWELGNWLGDMYVDSVRDQMRSRQGVTLSANSMARLGLGPISGASPVQNLLNITAPGIDALAVPIGSKSEIKIGEGRLAIDVHVLDDRVTAIPRVQQPMSLLRIDPGRTNPGGF